MLKKIATDALKTSSKRVIQRTSEGTVDLISNKITDKITKVSNNSLQNNSETDTNKLDKKRYITPDEIQEIIYELRLKQYNVGLSKNNKSFEKFTTK